MRKVLFILFAMVLGVSAMAQQKIQLRSTDKTECVKSDMTSLKASFSFSTIEAQDYESELGTFSWLSLPNTVIGGNEGDPQIPAVSQLIAVPFGAIPSIRVTSYSTTDYDLEEYGIHTLMPRQPDIRKDQRPEDVPFVYNEAAYQTRGLRAEPLARVSVDGTMRGVQVGRLSIEPVSYDPVNNKIRVFNDIEVEVYFEGADAIATDEMLVKTYSPYFNGIYGQLFNGRAIRDVYEDHPDLWQAPVKMLVIANRMFEDCIQEWLAWKTMKGIYVDVNYTDNIGTTASAIQSFIQGKYAQDAPTFLMIMGDKDQVPASATGSETSCVTDLSYSSVDGDQFPDMFHSRFSAETVAQMTAMLNKGLEYEQYTMPDPSYLNNVLLIAGEDSSGWGTQVGRPTIWYASNYYYNAEHGFSNVYEFSHGTYTNCYSYLSSGVGFANYTAHGSNTSWAGPSFTVSDVNNLTNTHKYFLAMGNCCQAADWGISGTSFGEAMVRAENKGAYAYIGSCPSTYWMNDYYFGVGPTNRADGTMPTMEETGTGCYDAIWNNDAYNTVNAILYIGNLAGNAAQALGYTLHVSTLYYWQAYHVLGDGSIMPYRVQPTANIVSHMAILPIGMNTYEVSAVPGSYVAISKDGVLLGTALVDETGTVNVPITPVTTTGDVTICVTAPQRIPYIATVPAAALEGAYISVDSFTPTEAHVGDNTNLSITFKNVGTDSTTGTTTVTLTSENSEVEIVEGTGTFDALAPESSITVSGFQFRINTGVVDGTNVTIHYSAENGTETWEGNIVVAAKDAVLAYQNMSWDGSFVPGETITVTAKFKNTGHYEATNAVVTMSSTSDYINITNPTVTVGTVAVDQEVSCQFTATISASCPETEQIPVIFTMTADGGLTAQGNETLKNACNVVFELSDSYGDGWNGNVLTVSFDDGSEPQDLTIESGGAANYTLEIGNGVHVTLTWTTGSYASECSFRVSYEGDLLIYQSSGTPSAGVLYEFDCNCAAAFQTFTVNVASDNTEHGTVSGGGEYSYGQTCTVTATPAEGYFFTGWTQDGEAVSSAATYSFVVISDMNLVAHFSEGLMIGDGGESTSTFLPSYNYYRYTLSQQIYTAEELGGAGIITSIAFFNGGEEKTRTYDFYLKITSKNAFEDETDWEVVSDADKVFSGTVTMTANAWTFINLDTPFAYNGSNLVLVANDHTGEYTFSPHMACRVFDAEGTQSIYVCRDGNEPYVPSSPSSYTGTLLSEKNQLLITKGAPSTELYEVTVSANPTDAGTVTGGGEYTFGQTCTVTATPAEGYYFMNWTKGDEVMSTDASYTFIVSSDVLLVANFTGSSNVTVSANPAEGGTVDGGGEYGYGETCMVTATPVSGYYFVNWTQEGEVVSTEATYSFIVYNDVELVANFAEGYMIGDGGTATDDNLPSNSYYNFTLSQQIYTSEELGDEGVITSIAFYNGGTTKTRTYELYLKATEKASFSGSTDWEVVTASDKVFSGSVTMVANEWTVINFSTPFAYDGTSNLVLVTDDNTGGYSSGMKCRVFNADSAALYVRSDGTNYDPSNPSDYDGTVLSVKNQIRFTKVTPTTDPINVVVSASPAQGGTATGGGVFNFGENCTVTATVNIGYYFIGWFENGHVVTTDLEYSFTVTCDRNLVATFGEGFLIGDGGETSSSYLPSNSFYNYSLTQQIYTAEEIGTAGTITSIAFYNNGSEKTRVYDMYLVLTDKAVFDTVTDWIAVTEADKVFSDTVDMVVGSWTVFTLDTPFEYDGTSNLALIMDDNSGSWSSGMKCKVFDAEGNQAIRIYSDGTNYNPFAPAEYAGTLMNEKNQIMLGIEMGSSQVEQSSTLSQGWNWWSSYIELSGIDGLSLLEESLGVNGASIKSQNAFVDYSSQYGWSGTLQTIDNESGYKINVTEECTSLLSGAAAQPVDHPITLNPGWNLIGYPVSEAQVVATALSNFEALQGDIIKGQEGFVTYETTLGWTPSTFTLTPGKSYMYYSNATEGKTLVYAQSRGEAMPVEQENCYWQANRHSYADNLSLMATVEVEGVEHRDATLELGAFVNSECRGSAKLYHVASIDRYIAFLTVTGKDDEQIEFRLMDESKATGTSNDHIIFHSNAIMGSLDNPVPIHFGAMNNVAELQTNMSVYPNPVDRNAPFTLAIPEEETVAEVLVVNTLGEVTTHTMGQLSHFTMLGIPVSGVYMVKVTCKSGNVYISRVVVK